MKKIIKIDNKSGLPTVDFRELVELQGDFKTLSQSNLAKLKESIVKYGFCFPVFLWLDGGMKYFIDGHQRSKALASLVIDGYQIPNVPYVEISAKNKKDAVEKLLHENSQYGTINPDTELFKEFEIEQLGTLELGDIDFSKWNVSEKNEPSDSEPPPEFDDIGYSDDEKASCRLTYFVKDKKEVIQKIKEIAEEYDGFNYYL